MLPITKLLLVLSTLRKKTFESILESSIFSFFHIVFYCIEDKFCHLCYFCHLQVPSIWTSLKFCCLLFKGLTFHTRNKHFNDPEEEGLTFSQTSPGFYMSAVQVFWKHCGKRRNCSWQASSPFLTALQKLSTIFYHWNCHLQTLSVWKSLKFSCLGKS